MSKEIKCLNYMEKASMNALQKETRQKRQELFKQLHRELGLSINEYKVDIILKKAIEAIQQFKAVKSDFLTFCNIGMLSDSDIPSLNTELYKALIQGD